MLPVLQRLGDAYGLSLVSSIFTSLTPRRLFNIFANASTCWNGTLLLAHRHSAVTVTVEKSTKMAEEQVGYGKSDIVF